MPGSRQECAVSHFNNWVYSCVLYHVIFETYKMRSTIRRKNQISRGPGLEVCRCTNDVLSEQPSPNSLPHRWRLAVRGGGLIQKRNYGIELAELTGQWGRGQVGPGCHNAIIQEGEAGRARGETGEWMVAKRRRGEGGAGKRGTGGGCE